MALHNKLGQDGERFATEFLIKQGLTVRETNWRMGHLEVDVIAQSPGTLHIVEVKTRTSDEEVDPLQSITKRKITNLVNAARAYVEQNNLLLDVQFDVMLVIGSPADFDYHYIANAFYPPLKSYR